MPGASHTPRLGLFGGTFNPVHMGHLLVAQDALEQFELTRVLFIPCARPAHKEGQGLAPARHRLAMLERAIKGDRRFEVSDIELARSGVSYSIDTVSALAAAHPGMELVFIIGADSLVELHQWREVRRLLGLCRVVTLVRPGLEEEQLRAADLKVDEFSSVLKADIRAGHRMQVSSSDIRERIAAGRSVRYLVPPEVERYIVEHSLYRSTEA